MLSRRPTFSDTERDFARDEDDGGGGGEGGKGGRGREETAATPLPPAAAPSPPSPVRSRSFPPGGAEALPPPPRRPSTHLGNAEDRVRGIERVECAAMIVDDLKILINLWLITIVINNSREYLVPR